MSRMKQPLVSVTIPVCNGEKYLRQCLDSVLGQTLKNFEMICVDDGSTDSSPGILESYAQRYACIKVLHQENMFAGAARNHGMRHACGKYLAFIDCDDFAEPDYLEKLTDLCEKYQADIGLCAADVYDQGKKKFSGAPWFLRMEFVDRNPFNARSAGDNLFNITGSVPWANLFRFDFIRKLNLEFQPLRTANDLFFVYAALANADQIAATDEILLHRRVEISTNLQSNTHKSPDDFCKALLAVKERLLQDGKFQLVEKGFANAVLNHCIYNLKRLGSRPAACVQLSEALYHDYLQKLDVNEENRHASPQQMKLMRGLMRSRIAQRPEHPLLSIVIVVSNAEKSISRSLDSIMNQTLFDIDVVCVNDGSVDGSLAVLNDYQSIDRRAAVILSQGTVGLASGQSRRRGCGPSRSRDLHGRGRLP